MMRRWCQSPDDFGGAVYELVYAAVYGTYERQYVSSGNVGVSNEKNLRGFDDDVDAGGYQANAKRELEDCR